MFQFRKKVKDLEKMIKQAPAYDADFNQGLTEEQVNKRIEDKLVNKRSKTVTKSYFEIIFKNIFSVLNIVLLVIASVMLYFKLYSRLFFLLILVLNIGISLFQDIKARVLVGKLSLLSAPRVDVMRDGIKKKLNFNELVLSDIIIVKAGDTIPCDSVILNGTLRVNESLLSGESRDVKKEIGDKIYAESTVTGGFAYARVIKVGNANYAYKLQESAKSFSRPKSEILTSLTYIIRGISITAISLGVAEIVTAFTMSAIFNKLDYEHIRELVDSIGGSVVGMIPIGMYLMTSITLTVGVIILSRHRILVRELYSIEMLARVDTICVDKTGTLTDGNMKVRELIPVGGHTNKELEDILSKLLSITQDDNLTARALKEAYGTIKVKGTYPVIPFTSEHKYSAATFNDNTYVIGAHLFIDLNNEKDILDVVDANELKGYRVLVIASSKHSIKHNELPKGLNAIGVIVLSEHIKPDAKNNIEWFKNSDVGLRIISGDSVVSLKNIAQEVGIEGYTKAVSLDGKTDAEVRKLAKENIIFGRVSPEQKKIIISTLREEGKTVAMVGDGVNDLLALKSADCSIAMASGSDAAKAASHLVSLDSNFSALPKVVEEGRRVINNLQRVCSIFLVKTLFAISITILFLIFRWCGLSEITYPFTTSNLMAWEVITIGIAPFFVALEPNKERIKGGFVKNVTREALPGALIQLIIAVPLLVVGYSPSKDFSIAGTTATAIILISVMSFVILYHVCSPLNKYRSRVMLFTFMAMGIFFLADVMLYLFGPVANDVHMSLLDIDYREINWKCIVFGFALVMAGIPLYFLACNIFTRIFNKRDKHE